MKLSSENKVKERKNTIPDHSLQHSNSENLETTSMIKITGS